MYNKLFFKRTPLYNCSLYIFIEMSYNDNGEFYCVLLRSKLKSVPAIVSKRELYVQDIV